MKNILNFKIFLLKNNLILVIISILLTTSCSIKKNCSHSSRINNEETILLHQPGASIVYPISGSIFNSIDPRDIANTHGFTLSVRSDGERIITQKTFELISSGGAIALESGVVSSNTRYLKSWNYYINDKLMPYYSRTLATTLMPQAIDEVKFVKNDSLKMVYVSDAKLSDKIDQGVSAIKIYTRNFIPNEISNNSIIYTINNTVITQKIFEALNPVFIKTLQRSTNKKDLASYEKKGLKEVVKIELFTLKEALSIFTADGGNTALLVDNIELPLDTKEMLKKDFFKEIKYISAGDEGASIYEQKHPGKKHFILISL
ncbi:hypothetical protein [Maribellus sp. YY47]|uniref:hypothetical protein n=1 Tax=Maribellus sp. YY47 TaxID=2929486 RepID=UPI0020006346|nr:hypothetical protein [Maribellus sp. YY47]MCK3683770.1 hypothetical protein [Maribellus sp. YY47]